MFYGYKSARYDDGGRHGYEFFAIQISSTAGVQDIDKDFTDLLRSDKIE